MKPRIPVIGSWPAFDVPFLSRLAAYQETPWQIKLYRRILSVFSFLNREFNLTPP